MDTISHLHALAFCFNLICCPVDCTSVGFQFIEVIMLDTWHMHSIPLKLWFLLEYLDKNFPIHKVIFGRNVEMNCDSWIVFIRRIFGSATAWPRGERRRGSVVVGTCKKFISKHFLILWNINVRNYDPIAECARIRVGEFRFYVPAEIT